MRIISVLKQTLKTPESIEAAIKHHRSANWPAEAKADQEGGGISNVNPFADEIPQATADT